jgi:hypothetical protein
LAIRGRHRSTAIKKKGNEAGRGSKMAFIGIEAGKEKSQKDRKALRSLGRRAMVGFFFEGEPRGNGKGKMKEYGKEEDGKEEKKRRREKRGKKKKKVGEVKLGFGLKGGDVETWEGAEVASGDTGQNWKNGQTRFDDHREYGGKR